MTHQLLNRLSFGPTKASKARLEKLGYAAFLEEQLHPPTTLSPELKKRKKAFKFVVDKVPYKNRGFCYYDAPLEKSWKLLKEAAQEVKYLPPNEVVINNY